MGVSQIRFLSDVSPNSAARPGCGQTSNSGTVTEKRGRTGLQQLPGIS